MFGELMGPSITQTPTMIEVSGINWVDFDRDITNIYGTTVMTKYMFRRVNWRKFTTDKFFLIELTFLLNRLLQLKNIYSSRRDIAKLLTLIKTETWVKRTQDLSGGPRLNVQRVKSRFALEPFKTQWEFLNAYFIRKYNYALKGMLLHGLAGSGKTLNGIMLSHAIGDGITVEIVPQKILYSVWVDTLTNQRFWKGQPPKIWVAKSGLPLDPKAKHFVFHYESLNDPIVLKRQLETIRGFNKGNIDFKLIIDEIHNFNDLGSKRTQNLIDIVDSIPFTDAVPMSATPFKAQGKEAYTTFAIIDNFFKGGVRKRFSDAYGRSRDRLNELLAHRIGLAKFTVESLTTIGEKDPVENIKIKVPNSERYTLKYIRMQMLTYIKERVHYYEVNMPRFVEYYNSVVSRYKDYIEGDKTLEADLKQYVSIVNKFRRDGYNNFTDSELSVYCKKIEERIEAIMPPGERKEFRNAKSVVKYVGLKIRGEALGNVLGRARIDAVQALVRHSNLVEHIKSVDKKTLIFTDYLDVLNETNKYLQEQGLNPCLVYGDTPDTDSLIKEFEQDYRLNPLVTTFKSLKEGYPLVMANQIIMMNAPWRSYILEQTLARIHREGQDAKTFFKLVELDTGNEENVTSRSIDIMEWSAKQVEELLGQTFGHQESLAGIAGLEMYYELMEEGTATVPTNKMFNVLDLF